MAIRKDEVQLEITFITDESKALARTINSTKELQAGVSRLQGQISAYEKELKKTNITEQRRAELLDKIRTAEAGVEDGLKKIAAAGKDVEKLDLTKVAPAQLTARAKQLAQAMALIPQSTPQYREMEAELKAINGRMAELRAASRGVSVQMEATFGQRMVANLKQYAAVLYAAVLAIAARAITELGVIVRETNQLRKQMADITGATGRALDEQVVKTKAISATFKLENREIMLAANTLAKEFNITTSQALDQIQRGLANGANTSGQFLENIREYSTQFKAAGASAEDFVNLSIRAEREGIFSDKGQDVVKEFGLRIREQTKATRDAMNAAFGQEFSQELFKGINDGSITTVQALQRVANKMDDTKVPANELQTVIADVFGGPGEDAGLRFIQSLGRTEEGLISITEAAKTYRDAQNEVYQANLDLASAQNDLAKNLFGLENGFNVVWTRIKTIGVAAANDVVEALQELPATFTGIGAAFSQFFTNIKATVTGESERIRPVMRAYRDAYLKELEPIKAQRQLAIEEQQRQEEEAIRQSEEKRREAERNAAEEARKQREARFDEALKALNEQNQREFLELENQRIKRQVDEQEYQVRLYDLEKQGLENKLALFRQYGKLREIAAMETANQLAAIQQFEADRAAAAAATQLQRLQELGLKQVDIANATAQMEKDAKQAVLDFTEAASQAALDDYRDKALRQEELAQQLGTSLQNISIQAFEEIGAATGEFLFSQNRDLKKFLKSYLNTVLSATQSFILTQIANATATEAGSKPFPLNIPSTAFKIAAITAAFAVAKAGVAKFAGGGPTNPLTGQRITGQPNITPLPNGDNMLAYVRTGEVILNERQQRDLGGPDVFRRIGVPGFADGGAIPNTTPTAAPLALPASDQAALRLAMVTAEEIKALRGDMNNWQRRLRADVSYFDIEDAGTRLNGLRSDASL